MTHYLVNYDITYYILHFLPIQSIIRLLTINSYFYQLVTSTPLFRQLTTLQTVGKDKLKECYAKGLIRVLKKLHFDGHPCYDIHGMREAAQNGHLEVLNWYIDNEIGTIDLRSLLIGLLSNGNNYLLDWFEQRGFLEQMEDIPEVRRVIGEAMRTMPLTALQWLNNKGKFAYVSSMDKKVYTYYNEFLVDAPIIERAAAYNRVDILQWLKVENCNFNHPCWAIRIAVKKGHLAVLQWYSASYDELPWYEATNVAAFRNSIPVLEWLRVNNLAFGNVMDSNIAENSKEWMHTVRHTTTIVEIACRKNYLAMLHWIQSSNLYFNLTSTITYYCQINEQLREWLEINEYLVIAE